MEAYIQASQQVKEDILTEYSNLHPDLSEELLTTPKGPPKQVLDNIEIVFRNSAKQRLFSERIRKIPQSRLDEEELLYAYLSTANEDSYNDSLNAISCCKKVTYILFTMRFNNFGIAERNQISDRLRKCEMLCPEKSIEIYNTKKSLVELMETGPATYPTVQPLVSQYLEALKILLEVQHTIYTIECQLNIQFASLISEILHSNSESLLSSDAGSSLKNLIIAFEALRKRGLEIPRLKDKVSLDLIQACHQEIKNFTGLLKNELSNIDLVLKFLDVVLTYIEEANKQEESVSEGEGKDTQDKRTYFESIKESLSSSMQEWLK